MAVAYVGKVSIGDCAATLQGMTEAQDSPPEWAILEFADRLVAREWSADVFTEAGDGILLGGRVFGEQAELAWRHVGEEFRLVFISDTPAPAPDGLRLEGELGLADPRSVYLWGRWTEIDGQDGFWYEGRTHRVDLPLQGSVDEKRTVAVARLHLYRNGPELRAWRFVSLETAAYEASAEEGPANG